MISWLTPEQGPCYAALTTASLAPLLSRIAVPKDPAIQGGSPLHAAGVTFAAMPAALLVVRSVLAVELEVISLVVARPLRQLGMARALMDWLRVEAQRLGWKGLVLRFPLDHPCTPAMQRLTNLCDGWHHSKGLRLVHFDQAGALALKTRLEPVARRFQRSMRYALLPWRSLTPGHRRALQAMIDQSPVWSRPSLTLPGEDASGRVLQQRDAALSQLLLEAGKPVGWLVVHRVGPSLLRVNQWWVLPKLQGHGGALYLVERALHYALVAEPAFQLICFGISSHNDSMMALNLKHLEPLAAGVRLSQEAFLRLTPGAA